MISYGGGVQSTALVVLAATGVIDYPLAVFANVGDDSESPRTLAYLREVATPWAAERGVTIEEIRRTRRDGTPFRTLLEYHYEQAERTGATPLPVKLVGEGDGGIANRTCTREWKARVAARWLRAHGATPEDPAHLAIGFSTDELGRATNGRDQPHERRTFPLLDLGLDRAACARVIRDAGLPVPPKSACWYCPFHPITRWRELRRDEPDRFVAVAELERRLNEQRAAHGKPPAWWTTRAGPLADVIEEAQATLPGFGPEADGCDDGFCWT